MGTRTRWILATLSAFAAIFAYLMGDSYIGRLPNHAGYFLVPVEDAVVAPHLRPRHTVVIVVDGLSKSTADKLESTRRLAGVGQCRTMTVGPITVSRAMYAVLSTGLEEDRTGSRNNDEVRPLAADSVWQSARRAGMHLTGVSGVPWWRQLFPNAFEQYEVVENEEDEVFGREDLRDLTLIHPVYVDYMGHHHGAASREYADAAHQADQGILGVLDRLDLTQDLVVVTADHGHMSYGGHGGPQREIAEVVTCFAGLGVTHRSDGRPIDARVVAPTLAVLLGIPFPRHMRALEDDLDTVFEIADVRALPAGYVAERHRAVERFRDANRAALARWLGPGVTPSWSTIYAREGRAQAGRLAASAALLAALLGVTARRRRLGLRAIAGFMTWTGLTFAASLALYVVLRHSLDFTSINARTEFLEAGLGSCAGVGALSLVIHRVVFSDVGRLVGDELTIVGLLALAVALHPFVYGWPLGFPLPGAQALFFPFLAPLMLVVHAGFAVILSVAWGGGATARALAEDGPTSPVL